MGAKETYQINANTVQELTQTLQFILNRISDRIDQLEGNRGNPTFNANLDLQSNKITQLGEGTDESDGTTVSQIIDDSDAPTFTNINVTNKITAGKVLVYDSNNELIHSFGDE